MSLQLLWCKEYRIAGKFVGESTLFKRLAEKVWRMNRSAKGLSMVTTNLDGFSLAKRRRFAKFAKLSRYTVAMQLLIEFSFLLYLISWKTPCQKI